MPDEDQLDYNETPKSKKNKPHEESFTMSAFEELFKKTLNEQTDDEPTDLELEDEGEDSMDPDMVDEADEADETEEEEGEEGEEEDLVSDLRALQDKLSSILSKLEDLETEEEEEGEEEYSEDDFDGEFGDEEMEEETEEEMPVKESKQTGLKPVNKSKIKTLQNKSNKVGKVAPKGGKAKGNSITVSPNPKPLGDKKKHLQSKSNKVKSSVDKGEFFK